MAWTKTKIQLENGQEAEAQEPIIISASRATDIPAFYADWFFNRLEKGYSAWTNPFNGVKSYISYKKIRLIVFWSKNPKPLLPYLETLNKKGINCYIQFTLNDYEKEGLERGVPPLNERIETFKLLVNKLGKGKVIWRFDPLILIENQITVNDLLAKAKNIGDQLKGYTEKMVFSYADIDSYHKVKSNLVKNAISYRNFEDNDMLQFAQGVSELNKSWKYKLATCGEKIDIEQFKIQHNKCVDDDLMIELFPDDKVLMDFLGVEFIPGDLFTGPQIIRHKKNKDTGQRYFCHCINSKDIGEYNTCPHLCEYCYANASKDVATANWKKHLQNKYSDTITGK